MSAEMGIEKDALVNQALHLYAHLHGFLARAPGGGWREEEASLPSVTASMLVASDGPERKAVAEEVLETAARLERAMKSSSLASPSGSSLVLMRADGTEQTIGKERFLIGRGRHCDLVVDNGKVSREHVALVHEDGGWYIEDLCSSNGTWYRKERILRRRIEDGDEYFVCSEPLRFVLR